MAREQQERVRRIDATLQSFKLEGRVVASVRGPTVTRFEVEPAQGEKISRFANLADDLALAMAVASVRIEAPIPGKSVIGLEVPNANKDLIRFREGVESAAFKRSKARLPILLGKSIDGEMLVGDLARMPHLLIAGSTGSGKSIAVNTLVHSLLYRFLPTELRFLMIDPKMVELTPFDGIPHLIRPVVTNPSEAAGVLLGAVAHMERRYKMMSRIGVKNLDQYNEKARNLDLPELPFIAIVIDELADLMITSPKEVESAIMRLAQMARATGMHLILATQRPSVDILTSLIKVNVPARMAFAVSSGFDSRTILDTMGAERLLGRGDMLYHQPGLPKPLRLQGPFLSEVEIGRVTDHLRRQYFDDDFVEAYASDFEPVSSDDSDASGFIDWNDDKLRVAAEMVINEGQASVSRLQRRLQVGHARAGKLMDSLEALGVVGAHHGSKPRDVLVTLDELPNIFGK
jgi:S-DNA-T family DNA segregation ATPase FtsK/SpoIIIE